MSSAYRKLREPETNTNYLLRVAYEHLSRRIFEGVKDSGHAVRAAHAAVFTNIDREGSRLTQLAERAVMTPQAMGELVADLVARGYATRIPDPTDGRAKLIMLTELGYEAVQAAYDTIIRIEAELEAALGPRGVVALHRALAKIAEIP